MRTLLLLSVAAALTACDDAQSTTAPANTRTIATPIAHASAEAPTGQGKPAPPPTGWTTTTTVESIEVSLTPGGAVAFGAVCPAGTTVVSGGYEFFNEGNPTVPPVVTRSAAVGNSWTVRVVNRMVGAWTVAFKVYALCAS